MFIALVEIAIHKLSNYHQVHRVVWYDRSFKMRKTFAVARAYFPKFAVCNKQLIHQTGIKAGVIAAASVVGLAGFTSWAGGNRVVSLNCEHPGKTFTSTLNVCIGADHAAMDFNPEVLRQLALAHRECGIQYVRFHGVLNPDMHVVRRVSKSHLVFNWSRVERLYGDILAAGCKPLVELSFMPRALASGKATCFYYKGNITPPRHYRQWAETIGSMVRHLEARFGRRQVRSWYFEVWNEPNYSGFSTVGFKGYMKLYAAAARAIKAADPRVRVGGPASAGMGWISRFIAACHREHLPLNFISCHTYGCGIVKWPDGTSGLKASGNPHAIAGGLQWTWTRIEHSSMPDLPLLITEWGPSYSSRDAVHDTYFQAVWLLEQVRQIKHQPLLMSYWALSDIFDEDGPQTKPFEGGFGIFNPEGIPKPTFFALEFLHHVQGRQLNTHDTQSFAAIRHGAVSLLAWSYHWPKQTAPDDSYFSIPHPSLAARTIHVRLTHLKPGPYRLRIYREGYRHDDAYTLYQHWGLPAHLSAHQLMLLRHATMNKPVEIRTITVGADGRWRDKLPMRTNGLVLLSLAPVHP
jgi:xylan 1,4-beta-xylosidase